MAVESDIATNALSFMMTPSMKAKRSAFVQAVETVGETLNLSQGDKVSISEEAWEMLNQKKTQSPGEAREEAVESPNEELAKRVRDQVKELKEEIEELEKSNLPEKEKLNKIQEKQSRLAELLEQLRKMTGIGADYHGGTRAEGAGNSVSSF